MSSARAIWRTVVVAGAMLGAPAIVIADAPKAEKPAPKAPDKVAEGSGSAAGSGPASGSGSGSSTSNKPTPKPVTKPRPRGNGDRPVGRGFVLA